MEQFINHQLTFMVFTGAQVALSVWTGALLISVIQRKDTGWVYSAIELRWVTVTCLAMGIGVTLFNTARGHYLEAVAIALVALLWWHLDKSRRRKY